jgi:hypothetical protein
MLDTSGSMTLNLDLVKSGRRTVRDPHAARGQGRVGAFNDKIEFGDGDFTSDRDDLARSIRSSTSATPTRLWDAVDASLEALQGVEGRRVVVVFTDGDDTGSKASLGSVIDRARADEVMIYAIGLESVYMGAPVAWSARVPPAASARSPTRPAAATSS